MIDLCANAVGVAHQAMLGAQSTVQRHRALANLIVGTAIRDDHWDDMILEEDDTDKAMPVLAANSPRIAGSALPAFGMTPDHADTPKSD